MTDIKLKVTGLSCGHCKIAVEKAALKTQGIAQATVSMPSGELLLQLDPPSAATIEDPRIHQVKEAIRDAGYGVI